MYVMKETEDKNWRGELNKVAISVSKPYHKLVNVKTYIWKLLFCSLRLSFTKLGRRISPPSD